MDYHYLGKATQEEIKKLRTRNVCAVCSGQLWVYYDTERKEPFLACKDNYEHGDKSHTGIAREYIYRELNIPTRREMMVTKFGEAKTHALAKYQMASLITRDAATEIVETLWRTASPIEKTKAILLCATYNLNPLMNHLFILPFKNKDGTKSYAVAIGIEATRLMAHRKHNFTYLDLTPRRATKDELEKILGDEADAHKLYFITKIKDLDTGAEAYGLGAWEGSVYGADKGNSPANMASIRSERQALKRLYPAEMPVGVEVVDEHFVSAVGNSAIEGEYRTVDETTGEITEAKQQVSSPPGETPPQSQTEGDKAEVSSPTPKPKRDPSTIHTIGDLYAACLKDFGLQRHQIWAELNVNSQEEIKDLPSECYSKILATR